MLRGDLWAHSLPSRSCAPMFARATLEPTGKQSGKFEQGSVTSALQQLGSFQ